MFSSWTLPAGLAIAMYSQSQSPTSPDCEINTLTPASRNVHPNVEGHANIAAKLATYLENWGLKTPSSW
jgi:hypothetical protein